MQSTQLFNIEKDKLLQASRLQKLEEEKLIIEIETAKL